MKTIPCSTISKEFSNCGNLYQNIQQFSDSLEVSQTEFTYLRQRPLPPYATLKAVLDNWISRNGTNATVENLIDILRSHRFNSSADMLTKYIGDSATVITTDPAMQGQQDYPPNTEMPDDSSPLSTDSVLNDTDRMSSGKYTFVGRVAERNDLARVITAAFNSNGQGQPKIHAIYGLPGLGKTSLCHQVMDELKPVLHQENIYLDAGGVAKLQNSLLQQIPTRERQRIQSSETTLEHLFQIVKHNTREEKVIVFIDNYLNDVDSQYSQSVQPMETVNAFENPQDVEFNRLTLENQIKVNLAWLFNPISNHQSDNEINVGWKYGTFSPPPFPRTVDVDVEKYIKQQRKSISEFVNYIADITRRKQVFLLISTNKDRNLAGTRRSNLTPFTKSDTRLLVKEVFNLADTCDLAELTGRLSKYDPLTIKQTAAFYVDNEGANSIREFCEKFLVGFKLASDEEFSSRRLPVNMNTIYSRLSIADIRVLGMLSLFPSQDTPLSTCLQILEHLPQPTAEVNEYQNSFRRLEDLYLLGVTHATIKTVSMHRIQQEKVQISMGDSKDSFWLVIMEAIQAIIFKIKKGILMFDTTGFYTIVNFMWNNRPDGREIEFLTVPKYLDDNGYLSYSKVRYKFLTSVTRIAIKQPEIHTLDQVNRDALFCIASRLIHTEVYCRSDYRRGAERCLELREIFPDFEVKPGSNIPLYSKFYISFSFLASLSLFILIIIPFALCQIYAEIPWHMSVFVGLLAASSILLPMIQTHYFFSCANWKKRHLIHYWTILVYLAVGGGFYLVRAAGKDQIDMERKYRYVTCVLILAVDTLCLIKSVYPSLQIISAHWHYNKRSSIIGNAIKTSRNGLPEIVHVQLSSILLVWVALPCVYVVMMGESVLGFHIFAYTAVSVIVVSVAYFCICLPMFKLISAVALKVSYFINQRNRRNSSYPAYSHIRLTDRTGCSA